MKHELKTWPEYFIPVVEGAKRFEVRRNDRNFTVGDMLRLREWDPYKKEYTGKEVSVEITYKMTGTSWPDPCATPKPSDAIQSDFVVLGISSCSSPCAHEAEAKRLREDLRAATQELMALAHEKPHDIEIYDESANKYIIRWDNGDESVGIRAGWVSEDLDEVFDKVIQLQETLRIAFASAKAEVANDSLNRIKLIYKQEIVGCTEREVQIMTNFMEAFRGIARENKNILAASLRAYDDALKSAAPKEG